METVMFIDHFTNFKKYKKGMTLKIIKQKVKIIDRINTDKNELLESTEIPCKIIRYEKAETYGVDISSYLAKDEFNNEYYIFNDGSVIEKELMETIEEL